MKSSTFKYCLSLYFLKPLPNCCKNTVGDCVGLKNITISIAGISNPSLNISTENSTCTSPLAKALNASFLLEEYSPPSPLYTATAFIPFSLNTFAIYSA